jgi:hypothetical protein
VGHDHDIWVQAIDAALLEWRQGDCVLGEHWFAYRFNPQSPLTANSVEVAKEGADLAESEVRGFAVVTQTCDIVRTCDKRPFLEIVPLVKVEETRLDDIQKSRQPQYAYIPGMAEHKLVADLDRVMTVEKAIVADWERKPGCFSDDEVIALGQALARKRARFAFPDDFTQFAKKLQTRLRDKHNRASLEGEALRALLEIRVRAEPSWRSSKIRLVFWFIRDAEQSQFQDTGWEKFLEQWLKLIPTSGRYQDVEGLVIALEDMTALEYVESIPLDLDHLSS